MKRWGVFTNFYNGITIDGREVFLDDYDTKDAALIPLWYYRPYN